jgi:hypothetical protein
VPVTDPFEHAADLIALQDVPVTADTVAALYRRKAGR